MPKSKKTPPAKTSILKHFLKSVWLFPVALFCIVIILTGLKISGTSVGVYHKALYGESQKDPDLLANEPRTIRSDEWLFITQMTVAQENANFPHINQNIGNGRDMSIIIDVPYKEWSAVFKPQNLVFFILPLEYAFAFKWWLLLFLLIVSCYFFVLRIFTHNRLFASIFATAIGLSPFIFWWYQTVTVAPLFYGFFILILGMRIINGEKMPFLRNKRTRWSHGIYALGMAYLLSSFALLLYPPFQIPIVIVVTLFLLGYTLQQRFTFHALTTKVALKRIGVFFVAGIITGGIVGVFLVTRSEAVSSVQNTVYPGARTVESGGLPPVNILSSFLQTQLQREERAKHYSANQSEASNFILVLPFLFLPGLLLIYYEYRKRKTIDWLFIAIHVCALIFLARIFIPGLTLPSKLLLLDSIPHKRLFIGLGFIGIIQMLYLLKKLVIVRYTTTLKIVLAAYSVVCLIVLLYIGYYVKHTYPLFISNWILIGSLAIIFAGIIAGVLFQKKIIAASLLLILSLASVYHIQPLYRGLGFLDDNKVDASIKSLSHHQDTWVVANDIYYENFGLINDRDSISGIQFYPDLRFWKQINAPNSATIYNRYAHIIFNSDPSITQKVRLTQPDVVQVTFKCDPFIIKNIDFVLSTQQIDTSCTELVKEVSYPQMNFYFYRVQP